MTILASVNNKTVMPGITPIADVPDRPTIGTATAAGLAASITFTAATTGGTPTTFTATSNPGSITGTSATSPVTVSGLTGDTSYTFTVTAGNSTGTSPASAASNSITAVSPISGGYDALATVIVPSGGLSSIVFAGIPTGYKHLQIRALTANSSSKNAGINFYYNSDTTAANYRNHYLFANGSTVGAGTDGNTANNGVSGNAITTGPAGWVVDILDYANTNKNTTLRLLNGYDDNGSAYMWFGSTLWMNTATVSSITLTAGAFSFNQHSHFALYGVK